MEEGELNLRTVQVREGKPAAGRGTRRIASGNMAGGENSKESKHICILMVQRWEVWGMRGW